jgi:hypothetical protein
MANPLPNRNQAILLERNREVARVAGLGITRVMPGTGNYITRRVRRQRICIALEFLGGVALILLMVSLIGKLQTEDARSNGKWVPTDAPSAMRGSR